MGVQYVTGDCDGGKFLKHTDTFYMKNQKQPEKEYV